MSKGPSIEYVSNVFRKTNISNPLIRTRKCAYKGRGVRNNSNSFLENFAYVLNRWPLRYFHVPSWAYRVEPKHVAFFPKFKAPLNLKQRFIGKRISKVTQNNSQNCEFTCVLVRTPWFYNIGFCDTLKCYVLQYTSHAKWIHFACKVNTLRMQSDYRYNSHVKLTLILHQKTP